ncbi:hypothetical protein HMSSN139_37750 [Paenibacillus sp. HMSSN-139]|nr:hypothetical protein HMSSN139_37750 [Paenibacillus sp. HMSSN-139]
MRCHSKNKDKQPDSNRSLRRFIDLFPAAAGLDAIRCRENGTGCLDVPDPMDSEGMESGE